MNYYNYKKHEQEETIPVDKVAEFEEYSKNGWLKKKMKKFRDKTPNAQVGDVFIFSIANQKNLYFYGKVLAKRKASSPFYGDTIYCVILFTNRTSKRTMDDYNPDYNSLLMPLLYLNNTVFENGEFQVIGKCNDVNFDLYDNVSFHSTQAYIAYDYDLNKLSRYSSVQGRMYNVGETTLCFI